MLEYNLIYKVCNRLLEDENVSRIVNRLVEEKKYSLDDFILAKDDVKELKYNCSICATIVDANGKRVESTKWLYGRVFSRLSYEYFEFLILLLKSGLSDKEVLKYIITYLYTSYCANIGKRFVGVAHRGKAVDDGFDYELTLLGKSELHAYNEFISKTEFFRNLYSYSERDILYFYKIYDEYTRVHDAHTKYFCIMCDTDDANVSEGISYISENNAENLIDGFTQYKVILVKGISVDFSSIEI